ncbi:MAG: cob(I)yrinic acid a,c-diamide adenosyltransferase [Deltaproteobacteria bacterium]|nr:cob(I)yrinic acid a,c-diamide adenosyltransferase [Deltaproteobacteria bacterium]RLA90956.1 MAG: cob(I)yrinic acid a,c-diamide adenosyltransferase [Deltaproteobacteria bacterium]
MKGYLQVYTGNGKGKTTAALGLAIRAVGAGMKVFIAQFVKGMHYSELDALKRYSDMITIKQFGRSSFIHSNPEKEDIEKARKGLKEVERILKSGDYPIVILDEANIALYFNLFTVEELIDAISKRAFNVEVVVTGRYAPKKLIEYADLVTEMVEIKHYYKNGIVARKGIEK